MNTFANLACSVVALMAIQGAFITAATAADDSLVSS